MSAPVSHVSTPFFEPDPLLHDLLAVSLTAINLLRPCYSPTGELDDFVPEYFNPAAQRMTGLPERPVGTARTLFPDIFRNGIFAFYRQVFETGEPDNFQRYYQADGLDNYFHIAARRSGERLWVSFTDTADQVRTAAENALRESQAREQAARAEAERQRQRFYDLLMQLPAQVAVHEGPDQVFTLVNPGYQRLAPGRTLQGQPIREAWPELVSQGILDVLDHVYQSGEPFIGKELPFQVDFTRTSTVEQVYFDAFFLPLRDAQGQVHGVLDFSYDVTEHVRTRRQTEQLQQAAQVARTEAERERAQLQAVLTQAPVAIALFQGEALHVTTVNLEMAAIFGHPLDHVRDRPLLEGVPELRGQGFDELLRQVMATQVPFIGTEAPAVLRRNGQLQTNYYNFVYQPLYDTQGQVAGVIDVAVEVTEQVLARRQVEQLNAELESRVQQRTQEADTAHLLAEARKQRLEQLFMQAPAAICIFDGPELVFELVNTLYQNLFPGRSLHGLPLLAAVPELTDQPVWHRLQQVYHTGLAHQDLGLHVPLARTEGGPLEDFYFNYIFQPRYNPEGLVDGVVVFCFEVTEQVLARQQVQALNEELTAANADLHQSNTQLTRTNVDLDTFVYTASHDLKAPITNIESITLALRDTLPAEVQQDELVAHLLDLLNQTVGRFQFTIGQLTDISRLQLAHAGPAEPVVLAQVVKDVRLDLVPLLTEAGTQLTVEVPDNLVVSFSPANLRSVVYNLLSNAVKYRALNQPSQVRVQAERTESGVVLTVQDNGLGMSAVQQRQLFGLFQRLHTHVEGTGVGLYITKRLIENAGGTITVQSQPNVGTLFTVTFPA